MRDRPMKYKLLPVVFLLLFSCHTLYAQEKYSLHGTIKSKATGETLINASVTVNSSNAATASNEYGFYSLTLPSGNYTLQVSATGMVMQNVEVVLNSDVLLDILLEQYVPELDTVVIQSTSAT